MSGIAQKPEQIKLKNKNCVLKRADVQFSTVALIGPDGAGKTTVAKAVLETCRLPIKYLYMGVSTKSSNVSLPTSRLINKWKAYSRKRKRERSRQQTPKTNKQVNKFEHQSIRNKRGSLGAFARLLHRISETSFRQLVSWFYQLRGNIILYDRHFIFEQCPVKIDNDEYRFTDRIYYCFLQKLYPRPELVIFLDAPAEVMYERKREHSIEYLQRERMKLVQKSCYAKKFIRVDSTKPIEEVIEIVNANIRLHCKNSRVPVNTSPEYKTGEIDVPGLGLCKLTKKKNTSSCR